MEVEMVQLSIRQAVAGVIFLATTSLNAQQTGWQEVHKDEHQTVLIDLGSIQKTKIGVIAWEKIMLTTPIDVTESNTKAYCIMQKSEYSKRNVWIRRQVLFDANNRQISDRTSPKNEQGQEIMPDTIGDKVCKFLWSAINLNHQPKQKNR